MFMYFIININKNIRNKAHTFAKAKNKIFMKDQHTEQRQIKIIQLQTSKKKLLLSLQIL